MYINLVIEFTLAVILRKLYLNNGKVKKIILISLSCLTLDAIDLIKRSLKKSFILVTAVFSYRLIKILWSCLGCYSDHEKTWTVRIYLL